MVETTEPTDGNANQLTSFGGCRTLARRPYPGLSRDVYGAASRRPGNSAEKAESNLFSNQWRGTRSHTSSRGAGASSRARLVLPLLSRSRLEPDVGRDRRADAIGFSGRSRRSLLRRPADAVALEFSGDAHCIGIIAYRHAVFASGRLRAGVSVSRS